MIKIFEDGVLEVRQVVELISYNAKHLNVLRIEDDETFLIGDASGAEFMAKIRERAGKSITAEIIEISGRDNRPLSDLTLYVSIPKNSKFDDIVYRCSQLGVSRFVPMLSSRTIKRIRPEKEIRFIKKLKKKARHGAELSMRDTIAGVENVISFDSALEDFKTNSYDKGYIFWEELAGKPTLIKSSDTKTAVFIGPEGGFEKEEIESAKESGLNVGSLGPLVLDVETASIAAATLLLLHS